MDAAICAGLSVAETLLLFTARTPAPYGCTQTQTAGVLFLLQFLAVKYYRFFLYHRFFSPLRHLPGPTVRVRKKQPGSVALMGANHGAGEPEQSFSIWPIHQLRQGWLAH